MTFTRTGNVLTSDDGRFCIDRFDDHRGLTYVAYWINPPWDWGWFFIDRYDSAADAKRAVTMALHFGGTE